MIAFRDHLPVDDILPSLRSALSASPNAVLVAAPGAGKTTRVPLALLSEPWLAGRTIIMLEPRRLAARRAAEYMSGLIGDPVGKTVGYRIRGEVRTGLETRVEIVTEGILTRMLLGEQDLPGTGLVIFDEFHERSIHADLGLALTLDLQKHLRPDLRIEPLRGNLDTRLRKLDEGGFDAIVLAAAGLKRLGLASRIRRAFGPGEMQMRSGFSASICSSVISSLR